MFELLPPGSVPVGFECTFRNNNHGSLLQWKRVVMYAYCKHIFTKHRRRLGVALD